VLGLTAGLGLIGVRVAIALSDPTPVIISYVLLVVVGLLSIEWLTRKLLRLA
jgi:hypothetical protein